MRYKALAKRFKQAIDLEDPVPVAYAIAAAEAPIEVVAGDPEGGRTTEATEMKLRCGQISNEGESKDLKNMQLRCGQKKEVECDGDVAMDEGCVVEALTPERFEMLRGSAEVADGYRRMIRFMIAGNNAKAFLTECQATRKNLDERLTMLLDPDMIQKSAGGCSRRTRKRDSVTSALA